MKTSLLEATEADSAASNDISLMFEHENLVTEGVSSISEGVSKPKFILG